LSLSKTVTSLPPGDYYVGNDLGQKRDHSVIALVRKLGQQEHQLRPVRLVYLKQFKLGTEYGSVLGYLKLLNAKVDTVRRILIDQTGVGEVFVEEAIKSGLKNAQGIMLSLPSKEQVMVYLKQLMQEGRIQIFYDVDFINELNVERYDMMKSGQVQFTHPDGTHDDRLWAFALAVYASRPEVPVYHPVAAVSRNPSSYMPNLPRSIWKK
jgi:phage FluMu gp28-like protein